MGRRKPINPLLGGDKAAADVLVGKTYRRAPSARRAGHIARSLFVRVGTRRAVQSFFDTFFDEVRPEWRVAGAAETADRTGNKGSVVARQGQAGAVPV